MRDQAAPLPSPDAPTRPARLRYTGNGGRVFAIAMTGAVLTFLTLGIYRFWLRTRLRRYHWSRFEIDGEPLQYTGRPLELLIGALIAIVLLGLYVSAAYALVNYLSLTAMQDDFLTASSLALFIGVPMAPFWPYAAYQSQRYNLSRLNWRGVRFGLEPAAWRYSRLALFWGAAQILSLGLLTPMADVAKRRFITERMRFGDVRFGFNARPWRLVGPFLPVVIFAFGLIYALYEVGEYGEPNPYDDVYGGMIMIAFAMLALTYLAWMYYRAMRLGYFLRCTTVDGAALQTTLSGKRVFGIALGAGAVALLCAWLLLIGAAALFAEYWFTLYREFSWALDQAGLAWETFEIFLTTVGVLALIGVFQACREAFYFTAVLRAAAEETRIGDIAALEAARQSARGDHGGAEGFADALDVNPF